MNGKDKCQILKEIRRQIAQNNDIAWTVEECSHKGSCRGTCPKCESEVRKLERELELRRRMGKVVAVAGISAACVAGLSACSAEDVIETGKNIINEIKDMVTSPGKISDPIELDGDVQYIPDDLSGYVMPLPDYVPPQDDIEFLDGEVALDYPDYYPAGE